jgi:hypothetical protein
MLDVHKPERWWRWAGWWYSRSDSQCPDDKDGEQFHNLVQTSRVPYFFNHQRRFRC